MSISRVILSDETVFEVPLDILMGPLLTPCSEESDLDFRIPLPLVSKDVFEKILEFLQYYHENPINIEKDIDRPLRYTLNQYMAKKAEYGFYVHYLQEIWDRPNPDREGGKYIECIVKATHYLDIKPLYELCCIKYADEMKNKSRDEIRSLLVEKTVSSETVGTGAGAGAGASV